MSRPRKSSPAIPPIGEGKRGPEGHLGYLVRQANVAVRAALERALADLLTQPGIEASYRALRSTIAARVDEARDLIARRVQAQHLAQGVQKGAARLFELRPGKLWIHEADALWALDRAGLGKADVVRVKHGDTMALGETVITFLHTPGHCPGGVCLAVKPLAATPDALWFGSMAGQQLHAISALAGRRIGRASR